jgi:hypothetical protein
VTNNGYKCFTFSMHRVRSDERLVLGDLAGAGAGGGAGDLPPYKCDALVTAYGLLNGMQGRRVTERNRHLEVGTVQPAGRSVRFTFELGTSGQRSSFVDPDAGDRRVFSRTERHIEADTRRGLVVIPTHGQVGLLVLEARGRSTGMGLLSGAVKRGVRHHTGLVTDFAAVVHEAALDQFLEQANINAVTLRRHGLSSDIAEQLEVAPPEAPLGHMELTLSPGRMPSLRRGLISKFRRDPDARQRLLSVGNLDFNELNVKLKVGERKTTLSVSADQAPAFVYHIGTGLPPTDETFYSEVQAVLPEVGRAFGIDVGVSWQHEQWSPEALGTKLSLPAPEVSDGESE